MDLDLGDQDAALRTRLRPLTGERAQALAQARAARLTTRMARFATGAQFTARTVVDPGEPHTSLAR